MDVHEDLFRLGEKEGLKGRKLTKAVESFTWNITVLKVPKHTSIKTNASVCFVRALAATPTLIQFIYKEPVYAESHV